MNLVQSVLAFVQEYQEWALPTIFLLALGESLAFISLFLPSTVIILGIAGLLTAVGITWYMLITLWAVATMGGMMGYTISYWAGLWFKNDVHKWWPFRSKPHLLQTGQMFIARWGVPGVFLGHLFGPVRAVVPVVAGMFGMKHIPFQVANIPSAAIWSLTVLSPLWIPMAYHHWAA